jgi:MoxR-like ATPase
MEVEQTIGQFQQIFLGIREEIGRVIVGHTDIVDHAVMGLAVGGHVLLEGVPGLGKTKLVKTLADVLSLDFSRVQFTPDLMPADIIGTNVIDETAKSKVRFQKGPIFGNIVLADEVNRATPKTQSALLEAMQEASVTIFGQKYTLEQPFFVMATQNPIEMEGTYPLPEAQLDRFLFKLIINYPSADEMKRIIDLTTSGVDADVRRPYGKEHVNFLNKVLLRVPVANHVKDYAIRLYQSTHPEGGDAPAVAKRFVKYGSSPRGVQSLILAAKCWCLLAGRYNVSTEDIKKAAVPCLRHRVILNFEGEAEGVTTDEVIQRIIEATPEMPRR